MKCGKLLGSGVLSKENVGWFYDRLESCFPGKPPAAFNAFRRECEARESEGQEKFGLSYLSRQNLREAREEGSDGANYVLFDLLKYRRATGRDDDLDLCLEAAFFAFRFYEKTMALESRRHGAP